MSRPQPAGRSYWVSGSGCPSLLEALPKEIAKLADSLEEIRKRARAKWGTTNLSWPSSRLSDEFLAIFLVVAVKRARQDLAASRRIARDLSEAKRMYRAVKRSAVEGP